MIKNLDFVAQFHKDRNHNLGQILHTTPVMLNFYMKWRLYNTK